MHREYKLLRSRLTGVDSQNEAIVSLCTCRPTAKLTVSGAAAT